jgi:hypothetical protein
LHPSHPFPVSQASKNFLAIPVVGVMDLSFRQGPSRSRTVTASPVVTLMWSGHSPVSTFDRVSLPPNRAYAEGTLQKD